MIPARKNYRALARTLADKGVSFSFDRRKKLSPQAKGAITRKSHRLAGYLNPENRFKFVRVKSKAARAGLRRHVADRAQVTKTGAFIQLPKKTPGQRQKISVNRRGDLKISTGGRVSRFVKISGEVLKAGNVREVERLIKKQAGGKKVIAYRLSVRGYRGKRTSYSPKAFFAYLKHKIMPKFSGRGAGEGDPNNLFSVEVITAK